jgi:kinase suppressor of Ras 2
MSEDNTDYENTELNQSSTLPHDYQPFNITYDEITDKLEIGHGRFGIVYKASWHGLVAIKEIDFDENLNEDSEQLKSFKEEVLNLRKTRHSNLILLYGVCLQPPKCAIVMSLCRGVSLHKYLHSDSFSKPSIEWTIDIATQIAQGMGYLHNKQMLNKDLRSKNIFIDGCKAVISDFGLDSIKKLCKKFKRKDLLPITKECLFYYSPELVRTISTTNMDFAFSQASDIFAFGTIWYEMLYYEYPFVNESADTVLYFIGSGLKRITSAVQIPKDFKSILLKCWSNNPESRPDFSRLLEQFRSIPKRTKLFRSPSHPVHIGRSLETLQTINHDLRN